jgi:hypothetical protein
LHQVHANGVIDRAVVAGIVRIEEAGLFNRGFFVFEAALEIFETDLAFALCGFPVLFAFDWEWPLLAHVMYFSAMWCVVFGSRR